MSARGFCAIGIEHGKNVLNVGTLFRTAQVLGEAAFLFTVGRRYKPQASDTMKSWRHVPVLHFATIDDLYDHLPYDTLMVGVEMHPSAVPLARFVHPERAVYLLGAEDHGLTGDAVRRCHRLVVLPGERSMNVAVAGSIVLYDRVARGAHRHGMRVQA